MARKPGPNKKPALTDEDAALFEATMKDADRLEAEAPPPAAPAAPPPAAPKPPPQAQPAAPRAAAPVPAKFPDLASGAAGGVDDRTMLRLRRGQLRPEARLDLHGKTQQEAHSELGPFIEDARAAGRRCIIIITGKGRVSEGGGVLRRQLPQWLNAPQIRPHILGFAAAQPKDGGSGALYVLLRRAR